MGRGGHACPKPLKADRLKAQRKIDRQWAKDRATCRQQVYDAADGRCQKCGRSLVLHPNEAFTIDDIAHIDEIVPRSKGGDPLDVTNCRCLCRGCHFSGPSGGHRSRDFKTERLSD